MNPVRVGIVGTGFMAVAHLRALRQVPAVRVAALCNPSGRHLDGDFSGVSGNVGTTDPVRLDMREVRAYRDLDAMLGNPDIDAVDITTPTDCHYGQSLAALRAGKHVLVEKPMARTGAQARELVTEAESSGRFLMPAMCLRFWPEWAWVKAAIADQRFGPVRSARFRRVAEPPAWGRSHFMDAGKSGGALLDLHIHDADFVSHCFGRPRRVSALGHPFVSGGIDHVVTQYEVACGAVVHAEGSWAMARGFGFNMSYTVNFDRATADYDLSRGAEALKLFEPERPPQVLCPGGPDGYTGQWLHFAECIQNGLPPRVVTAQDGAGAVELCEAELKSIESGAPVALD